MNNPRISASATLVIAADVLATELGAEVVILNLADGQYYGLDEVGAEVWKALASPATVDDVCRAITSAFDVEDACCREDVLSLLGELASRGLVTVAENS